MLTVTRESNKGNLSRSQVLPSNSINIEGVSVASEEREIIREKKSKRIRLKSILKPVFIANLLAKDFSQGRSPLNK